MQIAVHLWSTGEGTISSLSFLIIRDMSSMLGSNVLDSCWIKMFKAFIANCQFSEPTLHKHVQFLRDSFVDLCSLDVQRSATRAKLSIQQLSRIMHRGLRTKEKVSCQETLFYFLEWWIKIHYYLAYLHLNPFSTSVLLFAGSSQNDVQLAIYQLHWSLGQVHCYKLSRLWSPNSTV